MRRINWDVVKALCAKFLVAGGAVSGTLVAIFGFSQQQADTAVSIAGTVIAAFFVIAPTVYSTLRQTDAGKARVIDNLSPEDMHAVFSKVNDGKKLAIANDMPDVKQVVVADGADGSARIAAQDPDLPKVMTETEAKKAA
jgi:hypothetical protein